MALCSRLPCSGQFHKARISGLLLSTGNQGVGQLCLKKFRECGIAPILFPLILVLSSITGCIELGSQPQHASSAGGAAQQSEAWSGQLKMEIDPNLDIDLFSLRGNVVLTGNGTLPYLLLNATLRQGKASISSTKYLLMRLETNRDYSFEIAKNLKLIPGDYTCTLEASGPGGILASENRRCSLAEDQEDLISKRISSGELISISDARALYAGRSLYRYESNEDEEEPEEDAGREGEKERKIERVESTKARALISSGEGLTTKLQAPEEAEQEDSKESKAEISAEGEDSRSEDENEADDRVADEFDASVGSGEDGDGAGDPELFDGSAGADADGGEASVSSVVVMDESDGKKESEGNFVGSSTSKKYHLPDCRYALKIKQENKVYFQSAEEAKSQGYLPCKSCHP